MTSKKCGTAAIPAGRREWGPRWTGRSSTGHRKDQPSGSRLWAIGCTEGANPVARWKPMQEYFSKAGGPICVFQPHFSSPVRN